MRPALIFPLGVLVLASPGCRHDEAARPPSPPAPVTEAVPASLRLDVFDDDTPCRLVVRWQGAEQERQVVALGRKAMAAARPDTVLRPTKLALYWHGDNSTPDMGPWFSQWKQEVEAKLNRRFELAPGYPRVARGSEAQDYEPDRVVFLLGICQPGEEGAHMFRGLHYYESEVVTRLAVRTRVVEAAEKDLACPRRLP